jgi:hypothetical protein
MLYVANFVVIGNGDYTDEVQNCTADINLDRTTGSGSYEKLSGENERWQVVGLSLSD